MWSIFVSPGLLLHVIKLFFIANRLPLSVGNSTFYYRRNRNTKNTRVRASDGTRHLHKQSYSKPYFLTGTGRVSG